MKVNRGTVLYVLVPVKTQVNVSFIEPHFTWNTYKLSWDHVGVHMWTDQAVPDFYRNTKCLQMHATYWSYNRFEKPYVSSYQIITMVTWQEITQDSGDVVKETKQWLYFHNYVKSSKEIGILSKFSFKEMNTFIQQGHNKLIKSGSYIVTKNSIVDKCCSFEPYVQRILKKI